MNGVANGGENDTDGKFRDGNDDLGTSKEEGGVAAAITARVQQNLRYPRQARRRGIGGTVVVRFHVEKDGSSTGIAVLRSASRDLDEAAVEAVARASPFSVPPGWIRIPVAFYLD
ncbi:MAG: TonB family protein [Pseudomonadota bacterium]